MKKLTEIYLNQAKLNFLIGSNSFQFPTEPTMNSKGITEDKPILCTAQYIIDSSKGNLKSFDASIDKKHPLLLRIENLRNKGLLNKELYEVFTHTASIKKGQLSGKYAILNEILPPDKIEEIEARLIIEREINQQREEKLKTFFPATI